VRCSRIGVLVDEPSTLSPVMSARRRTALGVVDLLRGAEEVAGILTGVPDLKSDRGSRIRVFPRARRHRQRPQSRHCGHPAGAGPASGSSRRARPGQGTRPTGVTVATAGSWTGRRTAQRGTHQSRSRWVMTRRRTRARPAGPRLPPRRVRLHHLPGQLRHAARRDLRGGPGQRSRRCFCVSARRKVEGRIHPDVKLNYGLPGRWSSPSPWPGPGTSTSTTAPSVPAPTGSRCTCAAAGRPRPRSTAWLPSGSTRASSPARSRRCSPVTSAGAVDSDPGDLRRGRRVDPRAQTLRTSRA